MLLSRPARWARLGVGVTVEVEAEVEVECGLVDGLLPSVRARDIGDF